jgi:hypothetical protein
VYKELAERGEQPDAIDERRNEYAHDLLLALDEDIRPPSITAAAGRSSRDFQNQQISMSFIRNMIIYRHIAADAAWVKFSSGYLGTSRDSLACSK